MDFMKTIISAIKHWANNRFTVDSTLSTVAKTGRYEDMEGLIDETSIPNSIARIEAGQYSVTATSTNGWLYIATVPHIKELTTGVSFIMIPEITSTSKNPVLNINNFGQMGIKRNLSSSNANYYEGPFTSWLYAGRPVRLIYNGTCWIAESLSKPDVRDIEGTLSIDHGGTGGTTVENARNNLKVYSKTEVNSKVFTIQCNIDTLEESIFHNTYPNYLLDSMCAKSHYDACVSPYKTSENYRFEIHVPANQESFALVEIKYMGNIIYKLLGFNSTSDEGFSETKFTCSTQASGISLIDLYKYGFDIVYKNANQSIIDPTTIDYPVYMRFCDINAP
jgi:hypothetical protein